MLFDLSSVTQSCPTLCDPIDCSMPGFPVLHHFPELAQTCVHQVSNVIQPSHFCHPLLLPSILPSTRVFSSESVLHIRWPKYLSFSISPSNGYSGLIFFKIEWFDLLAVQMDSQESSSAPQFESINSLALSLLYSPTHTSVHDYWKNQSFDYMDLCCQREAFAFQYPV